MNQIQRAVFALAAIIPVAVCAETTFTYQGRLANTGQPADGPHDFVFRLYDAETSGTQSGTDLALANVIVTGGVFSVELDFGDTPFNSSPRWLEIEVRQSGAGMYTTLSPRQRVGASPFAIETLFVAQGSVDTAALQNGSVTTSKIASNAVSSEKIMDGTITPSDINGGLYARKGQVLYYTATASVGFGIQRVTVTCAGARDIPVVHVCNVPSDTSDLTILSERLTSIDNDVNPARLRCTAENRDPANPETLTATIGCIPVD